MIDEKKIQNGIKACFDRRIDDKVEREFMRDPLLAYTRAFNDAIGWFKKAIWHEASVKPEGNAVILYQWLDDRGTMDVGIDGVFSDVEWAKFVAYNSITKWCYIEDLLPKGGKK